MKLENWYPVLGLWINGDVYGNPRFEDGDHISTSRVQHLHERDGKLFAHTLNSIYELGTPQADFAETQPDWHDKMIEIFGKQEVQ